MKLVEYIYLILEIVELCERGELRQHILKARGRETFQQLPRASEKLENTGTEKDHSAVIWAEETFWGRVSLCGEV